MKEMSYLQFQNCTFNNIHSQLVKATEQHILFYNSNFTEIGTKVPFFESQVDLDEQTLSFDGLKDLLISESKIFDNEAIPVSMF